MKREEIEEKIKKLPKWTQDYINNIKRERDIAIKALNKWLDNQTPSPFYFEDWLSTGENTGPTTKRIYIQTRQIEIVHAGTWFRALLRDKEIDCSFGGNRYALHDIAFIPTSYQQFKLISKENMR